MYHCKEYLYIGHLTISVPTSSYTNCNFWLEHFVIRKTCSLTIFQSYVEMRKKTSHERQQSCFSFCRCFILKTSHSDVDVHVWSIVFLLVSFLAFKCNHIHTHTYTHTHIHTYTQTHTHIHTYTYTHLVVSFLLLNTNRHTNIVYLSLSLSFSIYLFLPHLLHIFLKHSLSHFLPHIQAHRRTR